MKLIMLTWMAAALMLAQDKDTKPAKDSDKKQSQDAGKSAASADPVSSVIPKGATEVEPNLFRYTDPQGKTWFYRRFPFGVSKWEDKPADQVAKEEPLAGVVRVGIHGGDQPHPDDLTRQARRQDCREGKLRCLPQSRRRPRGCLPVATRRHL